jgi:hypothetical protein
MYLGFIRKQYLIHHFVGLLKALSRTCPQRKNKENAKQPQSVSHRVGLQSRKGEAVTVHPTKGYSSSHYYPRCNSTDILNNPVTDRIQPGRAKFRHPCHRPPTQFLFLQCQRTLRN